MLWSRPSNLAKASFAAPMRGIWLIQSISDGDRGSGMNGSGFMDEQVFVGHQIPARLLADHLD
ncbi:MAG: hypothetical protein V1862_10410, partial [Methanobacteriota archaeon]